MEPPLKKTISSPEPVAYPLPLQKTSSKDSVVRSLIGSNALRKYNSEERDEERIKRIEEQSGQIPRQLSFQSASQYRSIPLLKGNEELEFDREWKKKFRSKSATLKIPVKETDLYFFLDIHFREATGISCIPVTHKFKKNPAVLDSIKNSLISDHLFVNSLKKELQRAKRQLEIYCVTANKRTSDADTFYQKILALLRCQEFADFKSCLKDFSKSHLRVLAKFFNGPVSQLEDDLDIGYNFFRQKVSIVIEELKTIQAKAEKIKKSEWKRPFDLSALDNMNRENVILSIAVEKFSFLPIKINELYVQEAESSYLQGLIHQFNRAGFDPSATLEAERKDKDLFLKHHCINCDRLLKLSSNASWLHAERLIRVIKKELFQGPLTTHCTPEIHCHVSIKNPQSYRVTQTKKYSTYKRLNDHSDERGPNPIGGFTLKWRVSYSHPNEIKAKLILKGWGVNDKAPIEDKWLFLRFLGNHVPN